MSETPVEKVSEVAEVIEKDVPSTRPMGVRLALIVTLLLFPVMLYVLYLGAQSGDWSYLLGGGYGTAMSAFASYMLNRQLRHPDWLKIHEEGFEYKFLNLTFRVGWGDVQQISWDGSRVIKIRLTDTDRVAFNSLVDKAPLHRTQFNPYTGQSLRRVARFKNPKPRTQADLADFLRAVGEEHDFHIAIPVFESAAEAERLFAALQQRHADWQPMVRAASLFGEAAGGAEATPAVAAATTKQGSARDIADAPPILMVPAVEDEANHVDKADNQPPHQAQRNQSQRTRD